MLIHDLLNAEPNSSCNNALVTSLSSGESINSMCNSESVDIVRCYSISTGHKLASFGQLIPTTADDLALSLYMSDHTFSTRYDF